MSNIDERVVQMKFDNSQFQKGVSDTNKSLGDLKKGLNLEGAAKGLEGVSSAASRFSLAGIASGVEGIASKFTAMSVVGLTALTNIANKAVNVGISLVKSLTLDPIMDGMKDYEAKLTSVQTIMNATGAKLPVVDGYFKQLDTYADKTIYNLTDMTGAFAKFTNAGIGMDKSVPAIKGIANMVALAGQDAGAASIAMYNLSQSMAGGFLTTTDYKSLNLANVATKEWKDQMIAGAVSAGTLKKGTNGMYTIKGAKGAYTDAALFNDALKEGWATTEVMTEVLGDYGDTNTAIGKKAQAAAQDVKSWSMMMDTLSASVGTGWTDTFEILLGNVEEAKKLFTPLTQTVGGFLDEVSKARNVPLAEWKELGGRAKLIDALKNSFHALMAIVTPIKDAFVEIFPPITGRQLSSLTSQFLNFSKKLMPAKDTIEKIKNVAKGFFAVLDIGRMIIMGAVGLFGRLFGAVASGSGGFLTVASNIGKFLVSVRDAIKNGEGLTKFFDGLGTVLIGAINGIKTAAKWFGDLFNGFQKVDTGGATAMLGNVKDRMDQVKEAGSGLSKVWKVLGDIVKGIWEFFAPLGQKIGEVAGRIGTGIADAMKNVNFNTVLDAINTGLFAGLFLMVRKFFNGGFKKEAESGGGIIQTIKDTLGGLTDTLKTMQGVLKAATLFMIAAAVAMLAGSILLLSTIDSGKLAMSLGAIGAMMAMLVGAMATLDKISSLGGAVKITALAIAMSLFAVAIGILAISVKALSTMSWEELAKGLGAVLVMLFGIAGALKVMSGVKGNLISAGIGMMFIAVAIKILASAVKDFSELSWEEMARGLTGVGAVLAALTIFTRLAKANKGAMGSAAGLILLGVALKIIASVVKDFGEMGVGAMIQGLAAITGVLAVLAGFTRIVQPKGMISTGIAMAILGGALKIMASALGDFADLSWEDLGRGMTGLGGALFIIAAAMNMMPKGMLVTAAALVVVGAALKIIASAIKDMSGMSWEEIGRGFVVLAGALLVLTVAMYAMQNALLGAVAMIVVAKALSFMAPALVALGGMSWDDIGRGLTMLAAAFLVLGVAGLLLTPVIPTLFALGTAMMLLGVGSVLVGVGLLAFAAGLTALAAAGAIGTAALIAIISGIIGLLPMIFTQLGLAIIAFAVVIGEGAPALVGALVAVLTSLIQAIVTVIPLIVNALVVLLTALINAIITMTPLFINALIVILMGILRVIVTMTPAVINVMVVLIKSLVNAIVGMVLFFVDAGMRLIIGIINGIARNIGKVIDAGVDLVVKFIDGIRRNIPKLIKAAADLIVDFVDGLANGIRDNTQRMKDAAGNLAGAIIDGMTGGMFSGIADVMAGAADLGNKAIAAIQGAIDSHSPSKKSYKLGRYVSQGLALGITSESGRVEKSSAELGAMALETLKATMSDIADAVMMDVDSQPTIRPVLDLTEVRKSAGQLGGMLTPPTLSVDGSYAKATTLLARERANREATDATAEVLSKSGDQLTYNQYINSPKAVSNAEIYRGTKNQLSVSKLKKKGALTP